MFAFVAWFVDEAGRGRRERERLHRARGYLSRCTPAAWRHVEWTGEGWGIVARQAQPGEWRWTFAERSERTCAVAAGIALGAKPETPAELATRLLNGEDVHVELAAPFGLLAVGRRSGEFVAQQDWHGMGQIFVYQHAGAVAFSNRPTALPEVMGRETAPNRDGWSHYLGTGFFTGSRSPVRGVRLLDPGERVSGRRDGAQGWRISHEQRQNLDDFALRATGDDASLDDIAESVAEGVRRTTRTLSHHYTGSLGMGLSGGKDSRMLAAVLVNEGLVSRFRTNEQNPMEGEVARELTRILSNRRGVVPGHEFYVATSPDTEPAIDVADRARRLHERHDFMFRSTYLNRPLGQPYSDTFGRPGVLGVMGEYLSDYWMNEAWVRAPESVTHADARTVVLRKLRGSGVPRQHLRPAVQETIERFGEELYSRAVELGLGPIAATKYCYMMGRIRRACTSLTHVEQVMPLAVPETIQASFQLSPRQLADQALHRRVIDRHLPEWNDVAHAAKMPQEHAVRIWQGRGLHDLRRLLDDGPGPISRLVLRPALRRALDRAAAGRGDKRDDRILSQFAMAAAADQMLPRPASPATKSWGAKLRNRASGKGS